MLGQEKQTRSEVFVSNPISESVIHETEITTPEVVTGSPQKEYQTRKVIFRGYQIIWYILGVIEVVLIFRILLKLLGANAQSGFTSLIYAVSAPFTIPFAGIFGITGISGMVFEWSSLIAMAVYAILAYGLISLFQFVKPTNQEEVEQTLDKQ